MRRLLGRFGWSRQDESDLDEEMRLHLDLEVERLVGAGLDPAAARRLARRRFGNVALAAEDSREVWGLPPVDTWLRDVAIALRSFRRSPLLSLVAVSTLALGLGATGSAFVLLDSLVLRPLPVERPDELVLLRWTAPDFPAASLSGWLDRDDTGTQWSSSALPEPGFRALAAARTLAEVAAFAELDSLNVVVGEEAERHTAQAVSGGYFGMLGVDSEVGRLLSPADDRPGAAAAVVLDHAYWQSRFAGDPGVVGRTLRVNGHPFTVVGVAEPGFAGTLQAGTRPAFHLPIAAQPLVGAGTVSVGDDSAWWLHVLGRRRPGASLAAVEAEVGSLFAGYLAGVPPPEGEERVPVRLAAELGAHGLVEARRMLLRPLLLLQALLALVLVIACANVGNLLLARGAARRHEMATRLSLGAARPRLVRQLLTESVTLTLAGGVAGAALLLWLPPLLAATLPQLAGTVVPAGTPASRGVAAILVAATICGLVLGIVPALRATRSGVGRLLGERGPAPRSGRIARGLVVAQVALSLLVVAAAALLGRSLWNLERADLGFATGGRLLVEVDAATAGYEGEDRLRLYDRALADLGSLPGVRAAALSRHALLSGRAAVSPLFHVGADGPATPSPGAIWRLAVSDGFLATMEIPLVAGRGFAPTDAPGAERVAIVNREAVRRYFGGRSPLGQEIAFSDDESQPTEIVGVAGDAFYDQARNGVLPTIYTPWRQDVDALRTATFVLAADGGPPPALERPARAALARLDADLPVFGVRTQDQQVDEALLESRRLAQVAALFALLALLLASIGVYGVTAYGVVQRRPEIGIRVALGSGRRRVLWLVLRDVAATLALGVAAGVLAAALASRLLADRLYGVSPTDPSTIAAGALLLALVALLAGALPARQAARLDPVEALHRQ